MELPKVILRYAMLMQLLSWPTTFCLTAEPTTETTATTSTEQILFNAAIIDNDRMYNRYLEEPKAFIYPTITDQFSSSHVDSRGNPFALMYNHYLETPVRSRLSKLLTFEGDEIRKLLKSGTNQVTESDSLAVKVELTCCRKYFNPVYKRDQVALAQQFNLIFLLYDISDRITFDDAEKFLGAIQKFRNKNSIFALVANQSN